MIKAHKIRLNPSDEQEHYFRKAAGTARFVYNWGLAEWRRHKAAHPDEAHGVMAIKKDFNALKGEQYPWVYEVAKDVAEGAFTNLSAGLKNYFESKNGKRKGARVGFPRFKARKDRRQSFHLNNDKFKVRDHSLYVPKLGWVNMAEALRWEGKILGAVVSKEAGRWYISISVEVDQPEAFPFPRYSTGLDLGLKRLVVLSDGTQYENQVLLRSELIHLKRLSRRLSRRQKGSQRWGRAKDQLARFHGRIANRRADHLHKLTTELASTYEVLGMEDLNVVGMLRNHRLALSLADASFGEIRRQLQYKSDWFGGRVVWIDRFYPSSQICSVCGVKNPGLRVEEREWTCRNYGRHHDRDVNAARNIHAEAVRLLKKTPVVATSGKRLVDRVEDHHGGNPGGSENDPVCNHLCTLER
jgi:putative transposase